MSDGIKKVEGIVNRTVFSQTAEIYDVGDMVEEDGHVIGGVRLTYYHNTEDEEHKMEIGLPRRIARKLGRLLYKRVLVRISALPPEDQDDLYDEYELTGEEKALQQMASQCKDETHETTLACRSCGMMICTACILARIPAGTEYVWVCSCGDADAIGIIGRQR